MNISEKLKSNYSDSLPDFDSDQQPGAGLLDENQWLKVADCFGATSRELQVCQCLFDGHTREETAESMGIKVRTVRHYMERIHTKLHVSNRVQLVLRIIQFRDEFTRRNSEAGERETLSQTQHR